METITEKTIDIKKVLRDKMGKKARWVPGFATSWLRRIIHEDQCNQFLWDARDLKGTAWLEACLQFLDTKVELTGEENFPAKDDGRLYTFVSNHPMGGIDGVALGTVIGRQYGDNFRYLVNDLLMNLPGLAPLCIPINKTGGQSRQFPAMVEAGFKSNYHMLMFPAGLCSRRRDGEIRDLPWKKTFITKSVETHRDVVPIHFGGRNSNFFYRLSNFSDRYIKKVNVAMLFLVDEMYKNTGNTFPVHIGKPIPWQTFTDKSKTPAEWAEYVKEQVYLSPLSSSQSKASSAGARGEGA
ncbi:MAG: glycerol acyltransferase [Prevotella sp.]|jgi:putative hemolysin|nr:glycerol acyltransferase [Prevotella sp.]